MKTLPSAGSRLAEAMIQATTEEQLLHEACSFVSSEFNGSACDLFISSGKGTLVLRGSTHRPNLVGRVRVAQEVGLVGRVSSENRPVKIESELSKDPLYKAIHLSSESDYVSALAVPLPGADQSTGALVVYRAEPWKMSGLECATAVRLAGEISIGLRLYKSGFEAATQSSRLGALSEVSKTLTDSPYLEEILQLLVNLTAQRFDFKVVTVRLFDEKRQVLVLRATQATNKAYQNKRAIKLGESIAGRAIQGGVRIVVDDVQLNPDYIGHDLAEQQGLRSMVCIPLIIQGRAVGVMSCYTGEIHDFSDDELVALETLAAQAAVMIENAKLQVRNTLMQEMHHRVKNNLQQVASLLRLQLRQSHYKNIEEALNDSLSRILAIAAVHELLSREDLDHVSIKSIAEMLTHHTQQSVLMPLKRIRFSVGGDDVYLNTNQATQVALILNEMVANAIEHGFDSKLEGEVHVNIEERDGEIGLWVSNNGDPLPPGFDPMGGQLGLQICRSLAGALGGKFNINDRLGWTVCEVKFARQTGE